MFGTDWGIFHPPPKPGIPLQCQNTPAVPATFCPTAQTSVELTMKADQRGPAFRSCQPGSHDSPRDTIPVQGYGTACRRPSATTRITPDARDDCVVESDSPTIVPTDRIARWAECYRCKVVGSLIRRKIRELGRRNQVPAEAIIVHYCRESSGRVRCWSTVADSPTLGGR